MATAATRARAQRRGQQWDCDLHHYHCWPPPHSTAQQRLELPHRHRRHHLRLRRHHRPPMTHPPHHHRADLRVAPPPPPRASPSPLPSSSASTRAAVDCPLKRAAAGIPRRRGYRVLRFVRVSASSAAAATPKAASAALILTRFADAAATAPFRLRRGTLCACLIGMPMRCGATTRRGTMATK